ncbi:hypothetical protein FF1_031901 [Malus domestica]
MNCVYLQELVRSCFLSFLKYGILLLSSGEAESALERLHQCAEKELLQFLSAEGPSKEFVDFHTKLAGLTGVTKNYFQNLVMALEKGLCDVDSQAACCGSTSSKNVGSSKAKGGKGKVTSRGGGSSRYV